MHSRHQVSHTTDHWCNISENILLSGTIAGFVVADLLSFALYDCEKREYPLYKTFLPQLVLLVQLKSLPHNTETGTHQKN